MSPPPGARRTHEILLCPGPVLLSPGVRSALADCTIGHRDARFSQLVRRLRANCRHVFRSGDEHTIVFIGGPATSAIEAVCSSLLPTDADVLVPMNGTFGARIAAILGTHGIGRETLDFGFGQPFDLGRIEAVVAGARMRRITAIAMTHHETSADIVNPVAAVAKMAQRHGLRLVVDATSSAGVEDLDVTRDGIDACITASGKCLHAPPGLGLVCVRRDWLEAPGAAHARSFSLDLRRFHAQIEKDAQTPFTPPVQLFAALDRAIDELIAAGGVAARRREYQRRRGLLVDGLRRLGLPLLHLPAGSEAASIVTAGVPESLGFDTLYARLKERGYLVYGCKAPLAPHYFQVAVMGELTDADLTDFLAQLGDLLGGARERYEAVSASA